MMTMKELACDLGEISSAAIFCHVRPDGDTIGGATALCEAFKRMGVKSTVFCASPVPEKFFFLPDTMKIEFAMPEDRFDVHIAIDCSTELMLGYLQKDFFRCHRTYNIDHHLSNSKYARTNIVLEAGACCETVFRLLRAFGVKLDKQISELLLLGIITDTGCFTQSNVYPYTLGVAGDLVTAGADLHKLAFKMYKEQPRERAALYAAAVSSLKFYHDGKLAIISTREKDFAATGATPDMTEGFIDFPMTITGVEVGVSIMEAGDKKFKISFRSSGNVNVHEVASVFGGGGHELASGCMINGYYEDVVDKLVYTVGQYL